MRFWIELAKRIVYTDRMLGRKRMNQETIDIMTDFLFESWALAEQVRRDSHSSPFDSDTYLRLF